MTVESGDIIDRIADGDSSRHGLAPKPTGETKGSQFSFVRHLGVLSVDLGGRYSALTAVLRDVLPPDSLLLGPNEVNLPMLPAKLAASIAVDNSLTLGEVEALYQQELAQIPSESLSAVVQCAVRGWALRDQDRRILGHRALGLSLYCEGIAPEARAFDALACRYRRDHSPQRRDPQAIDLYVAFAPSDSEVFPNAAITTACTVVQEAIPRGSAFTLLPREPKWEGLPAASS